MRTYKVILKYDTSEVWCDLMLRHGQAWAGLPVHVKLLSIKGKVCTGPAEGLVEIEGEAEYCRIFDSLEFGFMSFKEQKEVLAALEKDNWPMKDESTWLSRLLPCWFQQKKVLETKTYGTYLIHVILPLTDIEIVWPQDQ